ncbi:MAG TPA: DUF2845 domain-containing protein [Polyangiaceae bacterium]|nr:DUF2845 domain-containing protein [Polyangiaceae bacterium]
MWKKLRRSTYKGSFFAVLAAFSLSASARADSLACNNRIISSGDSRYEVRTVCGEPDDAVQRVAYRTTGGRVAGPCTREDGKQRCGQSREEVIEVVIDEWVYDFGRNRFIEYLTFEQGRLLSVRTGSYGHKPPR